MSYSEIKTMDDLEKAQRSVRRKLDAKKDCVRSSLLDVKESYAPSNLVMTGLRSLSSFIPVDSLLLTALNIIKKKLKK